MRRDAQTHIRSTDLMSRRFCASLIGPAAAMPLTMSLAKHSGARRVAFGFATTSPVMLTLPVALKPSALVTVTWQAHSPDNERMGTSQAGEGSQECPRRTQHLSQEPSSQNKSAHPANRRHFGARHELHAISTETRSTRTNQQEPALRLQQEKARTGTTEEATHLQHRRVKGQQRRGLGRRVLLADHRALAARCTAKHSTNTHP